MGKAVEPFYNLKCLNASVLFLGNGNGHQLSNVRSIHIIWKNYLPYKCREKKTLEYLGNLPEKLRIVRFLSLCES